MAKKTLNEATIRRFQKLANVAPLSEVYHKRDDYMNEQEEEEGGEDLAPAPTEDDPEGADAEMGDMDMDAEEGDMDGDLELTDEEAQAIIDLGAKLEAAMGMDDMGGDMDMDAEAEAPAGEDMNEEDLMEALRGISYVPSQGEIVNEVAQRVARRLKAAKLHEAKLNRALGKRR
tara:strand:- start:503 stop:1024 length:522 start_codon:yes stop_codon:yes gene_type:complete